MSARDALAAAIARSWTANAEGWTAAVRAGRIESRRAATDRAIVEAVRAHKPARVLDVGCGEGWLARRLAGFGVDVVGIDASAPLVASARAAHPRTRPARYHVLDYADLVGAPLRFGRFDVAAFNFALLHEDVVALLGAARAALAPGGAVVVQTVHPWAVCGDDRYADGWRVERFEALGPAFVEPMPWYFRTLASWLDVLCRAGLTITALHEPADPGTGRPLSLLLEGEPASSGGGGIASASGPGPG